MYQDKKLRFDWSFLIVVADVVAVALSFPLTFALFHDARFLLGGSPPRIATAVAHGVIVLYLLHLLRSYHWRVFMSFFSTASRVVVAAGVSEILFVCAQYFFDDDITRWYFGWLVAHFFTVTAVLLVVRFLSRLLIVDIFRLVPDDRMAFIGWHPRIERVLNSLRKEPREIYKVIGFFHEDSNPANDAASASPYKPLGSFNDLEDKLKENRITTLLVEEASVSPSRLHRIEAICGSQLVTLKVIPSAFDVWTSKLKVRTVAGIPVLGIRDIRMDRFHNRFAKRTVDIAGALFGLVCFAPVIAVLAWRIKRESPGPIFFRQTRLGLYDKPFQIIKLRSMRPDAEVQSGAVWAVEDDPRRLKIGTFMREHNLDELPQFWNVLKGEMSLVGPRPERPEFVEGFRETIRYYNMRHSCKPGVTGWAAVNGLRGNTSLEDRLEYDLFYIENWSPWLDMRIIFMTLKPPKNAY